MLRFLSYQLLRGLNNYVGTVTSNDLFGDIVTFNNQAGKYGYLIVDTSGSYGYTLYSSTDNSSLPDSGVDTDSFSYTLSNATGLTDNARLNIQVNINPAFSEQQPGVDEPYDNVDVEFNNRSAQATSLNSGRNIKGHLYNSGDKDWFALASAGDEIITLEVCPKGTSCFGQKSWVLYVFDSDLLAKYDYIKPDGSIGNQMEEQNFQFSRWVNETGTENDLLGNPIISPNAGTSNHMYLAYRAGFFDGALIGVVDPCFDKLNTVDIGVGTGARNYLIAISSPLLGDGDSGTDNTKCGNGSVVLEQPGRSASGLDAEGKARTYETTEQGIVVFPNSDDQYAIKITGTGLNPLNSESARARSSSYDLNTLVIPGVLVDKKVYRARLDKAHQARSTESTINFLLTDLEELELEDVVDAYRAIYNPENQQVMIPLVTDISTGIGYSVVLQFHPADDENTNSWFEVISAVEVK